MTQRTLRDVLQYEKEHHLSGGIYHHIQINLTYNSNHIEGSRLTHDQTRYIFETNTIGMDKETSVHPFQDGNGRVGRLIMFKECLRHNVVPFIISDDLKFFYYRGLHEWKQEQGYLIDTCRTGQDRFAQVLDYFRIDHA